MFRAFAVTNMEYRPLGQNFTHIAGAHFLFFGANTTESQLITPIIFHIRFSAVVLFNHTSILCLWNRHFRMVPTNGTCVVSSSGLLV